MNQAIPFRSKLLETLKLYSREQFRRDFGAGVNVMVMALPTSAAFAIASGSPFWQVAAAIQTHD